MNEARQALLERYGEVYGELGLAIAFTRSVSGEDAKRCGAGWDKTDPLPDRPFGAALLKGRGAKRNPAVVLRRSGLIGIECDTPEGLEQIVALDLPATVPVQSSAPHKLHFWFRPPNGNAAYAAFRLERAGVAADKGRYLLCPPALHPSGAVYTFLREPPGTEIATLPQSRYDELSGWRRRTGRSFALSFRRTQTRRSPRGSGERRSSASPARNALTGSRRGDRRGGESAEPRAVRALRFLTTRSHTRYTERSSSSRRPSRQPPKFLFRHL